MSIANTLFEKIFAKTFVYNILFEDSDVDCRYLQLPNNANVLTIAGAGCGVAALAKFSPDSIDVVDSNLAHLSLTALKTLTPRYLNYEDFYQLLGHGQSEQAESLLGLVMQDAQIPPAIQNYWQANTAIFKRGLYRSGLSGFMTRSLAKACGIDRAWVVDVAQLSVEDKQAWVRRDLHSVLNRSVMRWLVSSPLQLLSMGINFRQKQRIERAEQSSFAQRIQNHLLQMAYTDVMRNWFVWNPLLGEFNHDDELAVPPYLRKSYYQHSRTSETQHYFHHSNLLAVLQSKADDYWHYVNCSDVLDWLDEKVQRLMLDWIYQKSAHGGTLLIRSVEPIDLIEKFGLSGQFRLRDALSARALQEERSLLYRLVNFYEVQKA